MKKIVYILIFISSGLVAQPEILWQFDMNDMAFGQAAAADVDGDGLLEVVFSTYRNDGMLYVLNGEDGSVLWQADVGGCADAAPLIADVDMDDDLEIVLAGSCDPTTYCFDADSGFIQWETPMRGSDSPPVIGDIDNDGMPEILHGEFGGYVLCLNGEDGSEVWELEVDTYSWIQTAPTLLDANGDGQLDFVIANWSFGDNHIIQCYSADGPDLLWESDVPDDVIYHGVSWGDMDNNGTIELVIGDYAGILHCFDAATGDTLWNYQFPSNSLYIGAPTSMADLDGDGFLEVVFTDWFQLGAIDRSGELIWDYSIPGYGQAFRGVALADINNDNHPDVTFCSKTGSVIAVDGLDGSFIQDIDLEADFGMDFHAEHGPLVADFNNDGTLEVFAAGGHAEYPAIENNYGAAYMISWGEGQGSWTMFQHDPWRTACLCNDSLLQEEEPVAIQQFQDENSWQVGPSPFSDELFISGPQGETMVRLYDLAGELVWEEKISITAGPNSIVIPASVPLKTGIYFCTLFQNEYYMTRIVLHF